MSLFVLHGDDFEEARAKLRRADDVRHREDRVRCGAKQRLKRAIEEAVRVHVVVIDCERAISERLAHGVPRDAQIFVGAPRDDLRRGGSRIGAGREFNDPDIAAVRFLQRPRTGDDVIAITGLLHRRGAFMVGAVNELGPGRVAAAVELQNPHGRAVHAERAGHADDDIAAVRGLADTGSHVNRIAAVRARPRLISRAVRFHDPDVAAPLTV